MIKDKVEVKVENSIVDLLYKTSYVERGRSLALERKLKNILLAKTTIAPAIAERV
jgi:hypothetical protein